MPGDLGIAGIAADPSWDGLWSTENDSGNVGYISVDGVVGAVFDTGDYPFGIVAHVARVVGMMLGSAKQKIRRRHCAVGRVTRRRSTRVGGVIASSRGRAGSCAGALRSRWSWAAASNRHHVENGRTAPFYG